jgi:hypothetical protein
MCLALYEHDKAIVELFLLQLVKKHFENGILVWLSRKLGAEDPGPHCHNDAVLAQIR